MLAGLGTHLNFSLNVSIVFMEPIFESLSVLLCSTATQIGMESPGELCWRKLSNSSYHVDGIHVVDSRDEVMWGKTPSGEGTWWH